MTENEGVVYPPELVERITEALLRAALYHSVVEGPIERAYKSARFVIDALRSKFLTGASLDDLIDELQTRGLDGVVQIRYVEKETAE